MHSYKLVLSDNLYRELHNFQNNNSCDIHTIHNLLHLYKPLHLTNVAQLKRLGLENHDTSLLQTLLASGYVNQNLEELAKETVFKIVLSDVSNRSHAGTFTLSSRLQNNFVFTYKQGVPRIEAQMYLKELLLNCSSVFIYDAYFAAHWSTTKKFFNELLPKNPSIKIYYRDNHFVQPESLIIPHIKAICNWSVLVDLANASYSNSHDRYLIIDNKIEVILTSGFDYLFDIQKEITIIIREK